MANVQISAIKSQLDFSWPQAKNGQLNGCPFCLLTAMVNLRLDHAAGHAGAATAQMWLICVGVTAFMNHQAATRHIFHA